MHVFERGMHHSSVRIAKERLKSLLVSDRVQCQPDTYELCLLYTSPSPRDRSLSRMPSSA